MMVSPKAAQGLGDKFGTKPVCAGPYKFVERVAQDRIVVERFGDYWDKGKVGIDRIVYQPIQDSTVRLANLKSGGLDLIERVLATDIKTVREDSRVKLSKAVSIGWFGLLVNVANGAKADNPLGKDARVRRALELAIDREALNQVVFNGEFVPGNQWVNPQNFYYQRAFPVPKRDLAKAKALLKEAGVTGRIPIDFMVSNTPETRAVAEVVQSMTAEAGFDLKIRVTEVATALKQAEDGNFQLYMNTWSGRIDPDGNSVIYQTCGAPQNMARYCDKELDGWQEWAKARGARGLAYVLVQSDGALTGPVAKNLSEQERDGLQVWVYNVPCDERGNVTFIRAKDPSKFKWSAVKFSDAKVNVGDVVMSVGLLPKAAGYKTYLSTSRVSAFSVGSSVMITFRVTRGPAVPPSSTTEMPSSVTANALLPSAANATETGRKPTETMVFGLTGRGSRSMTVRSW
jgi:hypothetical protein